MWTALSGESNNSPYGTRSVSMALCATTHVLYHHCRDRRRNRLHTTSQASDGWFTPPTTKATVPFTTSHQADSTTESAKYEVGIFGRTTHAWDAKGDPTRTAIVILVTNEVYLQQLNHSIHLLQANWIQHFPVKKVVIFYTDEVCVSALRIVMTVLHSTKVVLEHVKHDDPDFLSNFPQIIVGVAATTEHKQKRKTERLAESTTKATAG